LANVPDKNTNKTRTIHELTKQGYLAYVTLL